MKKVKKNKINRNITEIKEHHIGEKGRKNILKKGKKERRVKTRCNKIKNNCIGKEKKKK